MKTAWMSEKEMVIGGVDGGRHMVRFEPNPCPHLSPRELSDATSAMRQLRTGRVRRDCFDDAIEREPVQC